MPSSSPQDHAPNVSHFLILMTLSSLHTPISPASPRSKRAPKPPQLNPHADKRSTDPRLGILRTPLGCGRQRPRDIIWATRRGPTQRRAHRHHGQPRPAAHGQEGEATGLDVWPGKVCAGGMRFGCWRVPRIVQLVCVYWEGAGCGGETRWIVPTGTRLPVVSPEACATQWKERGSSSSNSLSGGTPCSVVNTCSWTVIASLKTAGERGAGFPQHLVKVRVLQIVP